MAKIDGLGLGTWPFGGENWSHGWGPQDEFLSEKLIIEALHLGVEIIDTAPAYGLGKAEKIVGRALKKWNGTKPFISTKCGQKWLNKKFYVDLSPRFIRKEIEQSL